MDFLKVIRKNCLFEGASDSDINVLFDCMQGRIVMKSKGMLIAKDDNVIEDVCIVLEGKLLEFVTKLNGDKEPLNGLVEGDMFGLDKGYLTPNTLGYCIVAATDVTLLYLKISTIVTMCEKACVCHQALIHKAMQYLSERIFEVQNNNNYITIKGMRQKIANLIYDKYNEQNQSVISLGMDRNEMAAFLNVSRPSMSREMMRMRDEGIIKFWKDQITIIDPVVLEKIIKGR